MVSCCQQLSAAGNEQRVTPALSQGRGSKQALDSCSRFKNASQMLLLLEMKGGEVSNTEETSPAEAGRHFCSSTQGCPLTTAGHIANMQCVGLAMSRGTPRRMDCPRPGKMLLGITESCRRKYNSPNPTKWIRKGEKIKQGLHLVWEEMLHFRLKFFSRFNLESKTLSY